MGESPTLGKYFWEILERGKGRKERGKGGKRGMERGREERKKEMKGEGKWEREREEEIGVCSRERDRKEEENKGKILTRSPVQRLSSRLKMSENPLQRAPPPGSLPLDPTRKTLRSLCSTSFNYYIDHL